MIANSAEMLQPLPPPYRVAAIQFDPAMFSKADNLEALLRLTEEAASSGARLIVLPEMATTAYCWAGREEIAGEVEPIPGPTTGRFTALAARHDCWIVVGLAEVDQETGIFYNTAILIGPEGPLGRYRKTHAFIAEPKWAKDGDLGLPVFETPLGRIAMTICMDACYPETARVPALAGADVICFPTNWLAEKSPSATWMARAVENGVYFIAANRSGVERGVQFSGGSAVIDPDGGLQGVVDVGDGIAYGWIDIARSRDKRPRRGRPDDLLADRRPDAYGATTLNTYLWPPGDFHGLYGLRPLPQPRCSTVAVMQVHPVPGEIEGNFGKIARALGTLPGVELLVAPELAITGPVSDHTTAERLAETIPGPSTRRLHTMAKASGSWLVAGLVERDAASGALFNSAVLVGPEGIAGVYRKLHLTAEDRTWATPGNLGLPVFDSPPGRVGIVIGYDALFPEAARALAIEGADIVACPALVDWPAVRPLGATAVPLPAFIETGPTADHFHLWRERQRENHVHVFFANGAAPAMGWSGIFAATLEDQPRQEALVAGQDDGIATLRIDSGGVTRTKEMVGMRMPIWYDALQAPHASAARIARERGARPDARLADTPLFSPAIAD